MALTFARSVASPRAAQDVKAYQQLAERQLGARCPDAETAAQVEGALEAAREFLAQAQQASGRLSTLLEDLIRVSSAKAGKLRVQRQLCDLVDMVGDTIRQLQRTNPTRRIELRLPATRRVPVRADPQRIVQVVVQLSHQCLQILSSGPARGGARAGSGTDPTGRRP